MSDVDPAEVTMSTRALRAEAFGTEGDDPAPAPTPQRKSEREKPEREGLPPSYRMRADAHYVEHLTTGKADRSGESPAAAGAWAARTDRLLVELADNLGTIETAMSALSGEGSRIGRRVNTDLVRSQAWRAAWALRAHALTSATGRARSRRRPLGFLLGRLRSAWAAECRLAGVTLDVAASDWSAVVSVDEDVLLTGITGAFLATLGLFDDAEGTTITLSATASGALESIDLVQRDQLVTPGEGGRFFDPSWDDRPGGWLAGLGAAAARTAAERHGGDAIFLTDDDHGSTVRMRFRK